MYKPEESTAETIVGEDGSFGGPHLPSDDAPLSPLHDLAGQEDRSNSAPFFLQIKHHDGAKRRAGIGSMSLRTSLTLRIDMFIVLDFHFEYCLASFLLTRLFAAGLWTAYVLWRSMDPT